MATFLSDCPCEVTVYKDGSGVEPHWCDRHRLVDDLPIAHVRQIHKLAEEHDTTPARYFAGLVAEALAAKAGRPNAANRCRDCGKRQAGERDHLSPYCGACDPYGARLADALSRGGA